MRKRYRIDVRTRTEAVRIDRAARTLHVRALATGQESAEPYDVLILSPGAEPVRPPIPGTDDPRVFTLRSLADMDRIKLAVDKTGPERAVVVGGGYIGLEMAEALRSRNVPVTLVELAPQVFIAADPEMVTPVHHMLEAHGVDLRLGTSVTAIREEDGRLGAVLSTGESVACGMVILAVGVRPESKLARDAGLEIGPTGGIVTDEHMRTGDPNIFAVGDAVEVTHLVDGGRAAIPLAGPANRQGRVAADNAFGRPSVYRRSQGTAICKVFDLAIGMTGLSEKALRRAGLTYEKIYVHPASHASYYPGAAPMSLKLLFDPKTGKVLGAQAVGADGVDKRIDVLAVAIRAGLTVEDLRDQELSYAPPYGSAKDPINYAGFVASNVRSGDMPVCHVEDVAAPRDDQVLVDVRTPAEVEAGTIPGAVNVPVDDLRRRLGELPRDKELLVFCQVGLRGYLACRTLLQNGFRCRNLTGGYKTYKAAIGMLSKDPRS
jgi:NADPH-dependent 2,4-dienoyl-CoA reductase/sulfur reductase-like enzyme/rhodanese-related sulfurtransferase